VKSKLWKIAYLLKSSIPVSSYFHFIHYQSFISSFWSWRKESLCAANLSLSPQGWIYPQVGDDVDDDWIPGNVMMKKHLTRENNWSNVIKPYTYTLVFLMTLFIDFAVNKKLLCSKSESKLTMSSIIISNFLKEVFLWLIIPSEEMTFESFFLLLLWWLTGFWLQLRGSFLPQTNHSY